jgi:GxxExxY protein
VGGAIAVPSVLGPGLLEGAYELCLSHELSKHGFRVQNQVCIPVRYDVLVIENGYRIDTLVNESVVVELKAIETVLPVHRAQVLSYLRLGGFKLGYLLNFNVGRMREGISRFPNRL